MGFVICKNPHIFRNPIPTMKIYENKSMQLNSAALRIYELAKFNYVRFFFDKENHVLALEPSDTKLEGSVKRAKMGKYNIAGVFAYFGVDGKNYVGKYKVQKLPDHALLQIDLDDKLEKERT